MKRAKAAGNHKDLWMAVNKAKAEVRAAKDAQKKAEARIEAELLQAEARAQEFNLKYPREESLLQAAEREFWEQIQKRAVAEIAVAAKAAEAAAAAEAKAVAAAAAAEAAAERAAEGAASRRRVVTSKVGARRSLATTETTIENFLIKAKALLLKRNAAANVPLLWLLLLVAKPKQWYNLRYVTISN